MNELIVVGSPKWAKANARFVARGRAAHPLPAQPRPAHASPLHHAAFAALNRAKQQLATWSQRHRERTALLSLDAAALKDIGISRAQAGFECTKPFWRA